MNINSFHVYWSPSEKERHFKAYFTLTAILSALEWKKNHKGNLTFYADKYTADFFYKNNICDFWDKFDNKTLDEEIDPRYYDTIFYSNIPFAYYLVVSDRRLQKTIYRG